MLAESLSERGLKALGEVHINGIKLVIEGKLDLAMLKEAVEKCEQRIDEGISELALAIVYHLHSRPSLVISSMKEIREMLLNSKFTGVITLLNKSGLARYIEIEPNAENLKNDLKGLFERL